MGMIDQSLSRYLPDGNVRKTTTTDHIGAELEFVLSDETVDRLDDVIAVAGWQLADFKRNPVALFAHRSDFPIGRWENVRIENGALRGKLVMAEEGTSERINELRSLVRQGVLRAVSVGFHPLDRKPREDSKRGGVLFTKSSLLECSLVSVPANPNSLQEARSLDVSRETVALVFGEFAAQDWRAKSPGESAVQSSNKRTGKMPTIAERVQVAQDALVAAQQELDQHLSSLDNTNVSDAQMQHTATLNTSVKSKASTLEILRDSGNQSRHDGKAGRRRAS